MTGDPRLSAFHVRTAAANRTNCWRECNGVILPAVYADPFEEALAARTRVGISDLGGRWRLSISGSRSVAFLQRLLTRDVEGLESGAAVKALWLCDGGGARGAGVVARSENNAFWFASATTDAAWFRHAARQFGVSVQDISASQSGLSVCGPYAAAVLHDAGIESGFGPLTMRRELWQSREIAVSRVGEHGGYELWCRPDDAVLLWDTLMQAGSAFGIVPVGADATDILDVESGVPRSARDYIPATDPDANEPTPRACGLDSLVDADHLLFNGRRAFQAAHEAERRRLVGLEIDSRRPAPFSRVLVSGEPVGRTLSSVHSPAKRRAIALAQIDEKWAKPGTRATVVIPPDLAHPDETPIEATVCALPFLSF